MYILSVYYNINTVFLQTSAARHLKTLCDRKILTTYLKSNENLLLCLLTLVRVTKKIYFVIQCIKVLPFFI